MKKVIVTTTINHPTEAIEKFDAMPEWILVVIGDKKTPKDYKLKRGIYVSPEEQEKWFPKISDLIGWNCIMRRNIGFLWARELQADIIATIDDDNIPYEGWGENLMVGTDAEVTQFETDLPCFDPLFATDFSNLWHRGYPIQLLSKRFIGGLRDVVMKVDIQADFWNGDPDIDAICRMRYAPECDFDPENFPFTSNKISPFNSQNTFLTKEVLPHYFMVPGVGRMDDIWAAYHVQSLGYKVVYGKASVEQKRNPQDVTHNMKNEYVGYERAYDLVKDIAAGTYDHKNYWPERAVEAFRLYQEQFK